MLKLPGAPAVLYFHVWLPQRLGGRFYEGPESIIELVPEYYGLPSVSMRNAMYHMVDDKIVPLQWLWRSDPTHTNCLGHRCGLLPAGPTLFQCHALLCAGISEERQARMQVAFCMHMQLRHGCVQDCHSSTG